MQRCASLSLKFAVVLLALLLLAACEETAELGQACTEDTLCVEGLICRDGLCAEDEPVIPQFDGGTEVDAAVGDAARVDTAGTDAATDDAAGSDAANTDTATADVAIFDALVDDAASGDAAASDASHDDRALARDGGTLADAVRTDTTGYDAASSADAGPTADATTEDAAFMADASLDPCAAQPCFADGMCAPSSSAPGGFVCADCPAGFEGNGIICLDINGCAGDPCFIGVTCTDVSAPGTGFTCGDCPAGYSDTFGNGTLCTDYNECAGEGTGHNCDLQANCGNIGGSFTCTCRSGYGDTNGDGTLCEDFNECLGEGTGHDCDALVGCNNSIGSFSCDPCPAGYDDTNGDGTLCEDSDGCLVDPCFTGVRCTDVSAPGTGFVCGSCPTGFVGDGEVCTDIDECHLGVVSCDPLAPCFNTPGGAACLSCPPGYLDVHGDGSVCQDQGGGPSVCPLADDGATVPAGSVQVSGAVATSTWSGDVELIGDVSVAAGEILTLAAGTTVWVSGDHGITVDGQLVVAGAEVDPVRIRSLYASGNPLHWQGLVLNGVGSQLSGLEIWHATRALKVNAATRIDDTTLLCGQYGVEIAAGGSLQAQRLTVQGVSADGVSNRGDLVATGLRSINAGARGLYSAGGNLDLSFCAIAGNGGHGVEVDGSAVQITDCQILDNQQAGFVQRGEATGLLQRSSIQGNGYEGVRILGGGFNKNPRIDVERCNIYGNALTGNLEVIDVASTYVSSSGRGTSSKTWTPAQETFAVEIILNTNTYLVSGELRATDGTALEEALRSHYRWVDVTDRSNQSYVLRITIASCSSCSGSLWLTRAAQVGASQGYQVVAVPSGDLSLKNNYFGVFPDISGAIWTASGTIPNTDGHRGAAFGADYESYPYIGDLTLTEDTQWAGDVFLTGDVIVAVGATLTLAAGTAVHFVPIDGNGDGLGDLRLIVRGHLEALGTDIDPVILDGYGGGTGIAFDTIELDGTANLNHLVVERGRVCLSGSPTELSLADVEVHHCLEDGLQIINNSTTSTATILRSSFHDNGRKGASITGIRTSVDVQDTSSYDNGDAGLRLQGYPVTVDHCSLAGNGLFGLWLLGSSQGDLISACEITGNQAEGVYVDSTNVVVVLDGNNIYANAVSSTLWHETLAASTKSYDTPNGEILFATGITYYEQSGDAFNQNSGVVRGVDGAGTQTQACRYPRVTTRATCDLNSVPDSIGVRGVAVRNNPNVSSYINLLDVTYHRPVSDLPRDRELTVLDGVVNAAGNYWGAVAASDVVQHLAGDPITVIGELPTPVSGAGAP